MNPPDGHPRPPRERVPAAVRLAGFLLYVSGALACGGQTAMAPPPPPPPPSQPGWALLVGSPVAPIDHFMDAWFLTPSEGWVVGIGAGGLVFHTSDGGTTWDPRYIGAPTAHEFFRAVTFISPTVGWTGSLNFTTTPEPGRALFETRDGGRTFTDITNRVVGPVPVGICGLWSVDASTIYGVGRWDGPAVFVRSTDGGSTWQSISLAPLMTGAIDVYFFDRLHGFVVGGRGVSDDVAGQRASRTVVLMTTDGGTTWSERFVGTTPGHWAWKIAFPTPLVGYVATQGPGADEIVVKTVDGGLTWTEQQVAALNKGGFGAIGFISPGTGWVGRDEGGSYQTTDGGTTWQVATWELGESINRIRMLSSGAAIAVGKHIFKYTPIP